MFDFLKNLINKKDYELKDILFKINKMYLENHISEEQKEELDNMARENAIAENSYAPLQEQIDELWKTIKAINEQINNLREQLNNSSIEKPSEDEVIEETPIIEYPEYVQPLGSHDAYQTGDKISYNGKNYECLIDNCVWNPTTYPAAWQEITAENSAENTEDSVEEVILEPEIPEEEENLTE